MIVPHPDRMVYLKSERIVNFFVFLNRHIDVRSEYTGLGVRINGIILLRDDQVEENTKEEILRELERKKRSRI